MIRADTLIRRMLMWEVNSRVYAEVTPQEVRKAYERYLAETKSESEYVYRMVTFRSENAQEASDTAKKAYEMLTKEKVSLELLQERLGKGKVGITVSEKLVQKQEMVAKPLLDTLNKLEVGAYSEPLTYKGNLRMLWLENKAAAAPMSFADMESQLKEDITQEKLAKETKLYFERLRKHFNVKVEDILTQSSQIEAFAIR
jgi:hypothetical protein